MVILGQLQLYVDKEHSYTLVVVIAVTSQITEIQRLSPCLYPHNYPIQITPTALRSNQSDNIHPTASPFYDQFFFKHTHTHIFSGDIIDIHEDQVIRHGKLAIKSGDVRHGGPLELGATGPGLSGGRVLASEAGHKEWRGWDLEQQ